MLSLITQLFRQPVRRKSVALRQTLGRGLESLERRELLSVSTPEGNWAAAGGGMQDASTGLVWSESFSYLLGGTSMGYTFANSYANNFVSGGYDDWRLPTKDELIEVASHDARNYFEGWGGTAWSSTQGKWKSTHWAVNVNNGVATTLNDGSGLIGSVAVRGSRVAAPTQPNVRVFTENMTLTEGNIAPFSVVLDKKPTANVTIAVTSTDPTEGTSSVSSFVFTRNNWNVPQRANFVSIDDGLADGASSLQVVLANAVSTDPNYNGRSVADIDVTVLDAPPPEFTAAPGVGREGGIDKAPDFTKATIDSTATLADHVFDSMIRTEDSFAPKRLRRV